METEELLNERGETHGDFSVHAAITQSLKYTIAHWKADRGLKLSDVQQETLDMICHKIGRILAGNPNFADHWADIAGYAKLVADRCPPSS